MPSSTVALRSSPLGPSSLSKQLGIHSKGCETASCLQNYDVFCFSLPLSLPSQVRLLWLHSPISIVRFSVASHLAFHLSYPALAEVKSI